MLLDLMATFISIVGPASSIAKQTKSLGTRPRITSFVLFREGRVVPPVLPQHYCRVGRSMAALPTIVSPFMVFLLDSKWPWRLYVGKLTIIIRRPHKQAGKSGSRVQTRLSDYLMTATTDSHNDLRIGPF